MLKFGYKARWDDEDDAGHGEEDPGEPDQRQAEFDIDMTGDDAYAKRLAMSRSQVADPQPALPDITPAPLPIAQTGDEAYQRRLAMSQARRPISPPFTVPDVSPLPSALPFTSLQSLPALPPPTAIPPAADRAGTQSFEERVRSSKEAAAAVAARLSKMAQQPPVIPESEDSESKGSSLPKSGEK